MFSFDQQLFVNAAIKLEEVISKLKEVKVASGELSSSSFNYDYKSEVDSIISDIESVTQDVDDMAVKMVNILRVIDVGDLQELNNLEFPDKGMLALLMLITHAQNDSQINTSGDMNQLTDLQNVMLANFSYFELFFEPEKINGKTINEIFIDQFSDSNDYNVEDYESFLLDGDAISFLPSPEYRDNKKILFLGKMIAAGYGDYKIVESVRGEDGFDATVIEDAVGNGLIYYSCTDIQELDDVLFDINPLIRNSTSGTIISDVLQMNRIYESQKTQSLELGKKYLNYFDGGLNIGGFSLGGTNSQYAYFELLNSNEPGSEKLNNIILFNSYNSHDVPSELIDKIAGEDKLLYYVADGDGVSSVFGYDKFKKYAKPIYIDRENVINEGIIKANSPSSIVTQFVNTLRDNNLGDSRQVAESLIERIDDYKSSREFNFVENAGIEMSLTPLRFVLEMYKDNYVVNGNLGIKEFVDATIDGGKRLSLIDDNTDLGIFNSLQNLEVLFTGVHLQSAVEVNRYTSFNPDGSIKTIVNGQEVYQPSFDENIRLMMDGHNIYEELNGLLYSVDNLPSNVANSVLDAFKFW